MSNLLPWLISGIIGIPPITLPSISLPSFKPTVNISRIAQHPASSPEGIMIKIEFSKSVHGFQSNDINVTNGKIINFSGKKEKYIAEIIPVGPSVGLPPQSDQAAIIQVNIPGNVANSVLGGSNLASNVFSIYPMRTPVEPPLESLVASTKNEIKTQELITSPTNIVAPTLKLYEIAETTANSHNNHIILALQDGPSFVLANQDEHSKDELNNEKLVGSFAPWHKSLNITYVHQAQTLLPIKWLNADFDLDTETGKKAIAQSVNYLQQVVKRFKAQGKQVSLLAESYGTLIGLMYLKKHGNTFQNIVFIAQESDEPLLSIDTNYAQSFNKLDLSNMLFIYTQSTEDYPIALQERSFLNTKGSHIFLSKEENPWVIPSNKERVSNFLK